MSVTLILASAKNGVIGSKGAIPWAISDDLRRFKALTMGKTIVMGRKTWDSLPRRPLPGRDNVVVTRDSTWRADGARVAHSMEDALRGGGDIYVIGGAQIYGAALAHATAMEWTEVDGEFAGDAVFNFDRDDWREVSREKHQTPEGLGYSFVRLVPVR